MHFLAVRSMGCWLLAGAALLFGPLCRRPSPSPGRPDARINKRLSIASQDPRPCRMCTSPPAPAEAVGAEVKLPFRGGNHYPRARGLYNAAATAVFRGAVRWRRRARQQPLWCGTTHR